MRKVMRALGLLAIAWVFYAGTASATDYRMVFVEHGDNHLPVDLSFETLDVGGWVPTSPQMALGFIGASGLATSNASPETLTATFLVPGEALTLIAEANYNFLEPQSSVVSDILSIHTLPQPSGLLLVEIAFASDIEGIPLTPLCDPDTESNCFNLVEGNLTNSCFSCPNTVPLGDSLRFVVAFRDIPEPNTLALLVAAIAILWSLRAVSDAHSDSKGTRAGVATKR